MLCAVFSLSPLAYGRVPYPPYARYGMGRLCGERMGPGCAAVSVASDRREQETRLGAGVGGWPRPPLAPWGAGLHRPAVRHGGRGCTGPATCERFACPKDARNAAWDGRWRFMPMGCAIYPRIYVARCDAVWRGVSRLGRYILGYARHAPAPAAAGASPRPPLAPWGAGLHRPCRARAFRVSKGHRKRASSHPVAAYAGPPARTSRQEVRRARGPSELYSESGDMRGGFGSLAQARLPYAGRRPASRRQSRRRSRRPAQPPAEKTGASRAFPPRSTASLPAPR